MSLICQTENYEIILHINMIKRDSKCFVVNMLKISCLQIIPK